MPEPFAEPAAGPPPAGSPSTAVRDFLREFAWADSTSIEAHLTLAQANAVMASALARRYADLGLTASRFNALRILYHAPQRRLTGTDLGAHLGISAASVTRIVDVLAREGWVRRVNVDGDKRVTQIQMLESGVERVARILPDVLNVWSEVWAGLDPDERIELTRLSAKLRASLLAGIGAGAALEKQEY